MGFWKDFKDFAVKGNVIDLAVAVIIGGAFGKIVTAVVDDIIMPFIGLLTGEGRKFNDKFIVLKEARPGDSYASLQQAKEAGANVFAWGHFVQTVVDFLIIALFIFMALRFIKNLNKKEEAKAAAAPPPPPPTEKLLTEIRDILKKEKNS